MGEIINPKPFVKWAGGKRQIIDILLENSPDTFGTYIEPFIGGGALLFALMPENAIISDINSELIIAYKTIKTHVNKLIKSLSKHKNEKEYFYAIRAKKAYRSDIIKTSRFIYLNKTCFNGLYRENSKGEFNVPFGEYERPNIVDKENLFTVSVYLNSANVKILNQDFRKVLLNARERDFVYLDPPYHPLNNTSSFTKYTREDFNKHDQEELSDIYSKLDKRGCYVMLSNSNTKFIKQLYKGYKIQEINANRFINCRAEKRVKMPFEVIVKNW
ncbi:MAG: DNA adenine methylase [Deltaproteobacteria bacterium]|nr:DNA adenine methylase [Deltaproteobacteria bacterium]MCL5792156.1 DNA adenine methylase [Deltaproteobacteria bacterium]